ncbi:MAG: serine/threonine-protein kinase [Blastococcus sp.]
MALTIGSLLAGRYEITAPIATGGMGEVWKARDRVLDRDVAAKVLKSEYTDDPSFLARFRNEARHTAALTHPNIASVYDYGETEQDGQKLAFLVMELVDGQPLVTILHEEGRLPVDWTLHVLGQSADGLSAAHRAGVVHRDIKPGNLLVRPDGVVKLTDFGIAQARDATPLTRTGMVVGTAQYLSPEQAQGMEVNAASDVYSLGVVAYECLAGARPFDGASQVAIALAHINRPPPPLPASVPPAVRLLVERALAKDPADRFPDGGAFAEAIRRVAAGGTLAAVGRAGGAPRTTPTPVVPGGLTATGLTAGGLAAGGALRDATDGRTQIIPAATTGATAVGGPVTGHAGPMPPLHARPDDDWTAGDDLPPEEPRGRRWLWLSAALVLLLLVGGVSWYLLNSGSKGNVGTTGGSTSSQSSAAPTGVFLDPARFIGRPVDDVRAELVKDGLTVTEKDAGQGRLAALGQKLDPGDVAGLDPSGVQAKAGDAVVLFVARNGYTPGTGRQTSAPPTSSAPRTTASSAPHTTAQTSTPTTPSVPTTASLSTATSTAAASSASAPPVTSEPAGPTS